MYAHPAHTVVLRLHQALFTHRVLAGQVDAAAIVDIHDLDPGHVADLEHILDLFGALELEVLDLDEAVLARSQLDPGAEVAADVGDLAVVQLADLGLKDDVLDGLARGAAGLDVLGRDEDGAVVLDVDLAAGVGADLLDDLAAGADDLADLVGVDLHLDHLRGGIGQLLARLGDRLEHDLIEDLEAGLARHAERFLDDLVLEAVVLEVHLDGGDALLRAGDLEVHLAVEVLNALNVDEGSCRMPIHNNTNDKYPDKASGREPKC